MRVPPPKKVGSLDRQSRPVLLDTNVMLHYLIESNEKSRSVRDLISACDEFGVPLVYAPSSLRDVFYQVPRILRRRQLAEGGTDSVEVSFLPAAWACVDKMTELACAAYTGEVESQLARSLRSSHNDYEDNLIIASAETCNARYVATFDRGLQKAFPTVCVPPATATAALRALAPIT